MVDGVWRPTAAAILLCGKSPQDWLPGAVVEFVRYAADDMDSAVSSRRTAAGTLPNQLEVLWLGADRGAPRRRADPGATGCRRAARGRACRRGLPARGRGPSLGALNRAALLACDAVVIPVAPDLFSLQGLRNIGPTLREWREPRAGADRP